tara:strand:- start:4453 stop:4818 length:366 start_codon:yes stop_codon:yes gene_type:complete
MGTIRMKKITFYGYHGVDESERKCGGTFEIDLEIKANYLKSMVSDRLKDSIDYCKIYECVRDSFFEKRFHLLEALATHIVNSLMNDYPLDSIKIIVRKPHAPVNGLIESVEFEFEKERNND